MPSPDPSPSLSPRRHRRGFTTLEVIAAAAVTLAMIAAITPVFVRQTRLVAEARRERMALEELANQAERLAVVPRGDLDRRLADLAVSATTRDRLPSARLSGIRDGKPSPLGERLTLRLQWDAAAGDHRSCRLATWLPAAATGRKEAP